MKLDMYMHCQKCFKKDTQSGVMEVGRKGDKFCVICENCKSEVTSFPIPEKLNKFFGRGCCECGGEPKCTKS